MRLASVVQIIGFALVSFGLATVSIPAGIIAAGVSCLLIGISLERSAQ